MPFYNYEAFDKSGAVVNGKVEADNEDSAVSRLKGMGYLVTELEEIKESPFKNLFQFKQSVKTGELLLFNRQLGAMLQAGIPVTRALFALSSQSENPQFSKVLGEVARNVESGMSFSDALKNYPDVFPKIYVDMIRAGEVGGMLDEMLDRLATQLEQEKKLKDSLKSATFYPAVVLGFAFVLIVAILVFLIPVFEGFYPEGTELPIVTKIVTFLSQSIRTYWYLYIIALGAMFFATRAFVNSESGKNTWDRFKFSLPAIGILLRKATIARFCRTLSTLLAGGIPVLQALDAAGPASGSSQIKDVANRASEQIQQGQSIAEPLEQSEFFPPMVVDMIRIGEESGQLSDLLTRVSEFYEDEVATMSKGLAATLEPLLLIGIGLVIGALVLAIYLPIFSVVTGGGF
ncbi:type II secretion system F family protein [Heliorestis acidaminivorans]|uniref:Type II secretion system F family protein n=1 Tax=Heliorestis acidaminivorans TaxID=553427 RepID=A0A6I0EXR5_9FIRM|nr:type II secretion system F family protein [Heliorestis acidaminivorans]KAB2951310.1 type II secretion system F family protein [Heliorestis acidaminivorans]